MDRAAELRPPTGVLRRGAAPDWPARPVVARPLPTTVLWRWRYEGAAVAAVPLMWWASARAFGGLTGLSVVTALLAVVALVPPLRRWAFAEVWTVITPHRIRVACAEAGVVSPRGKLPAVLFTCRKPYGERVYLWCPDGIGAGDVAAARPAIASACWARDVDFFETSGQYPHLVVVEVVRQPVAVALGDDRTVSALWARFARHGGHFEGFPSRG
ncbi:hypothetical protein [Cryptosporangium minutisporangium]|uniref:hypothetical protein n=1 Tax=Cryptosporangium minutisporangium TaxID=113569 RepID=UPI0031EDEA38